MATKTTWGELLETDARRVARNSLPLKRLSLQLPLFCRLQLLFSFGFPHAAGRERVAGLPAKMSISSAGLSHGIACPVSSARRCAKSRRKVFVHLRNSEHVGFATDVGYGQGRGAKSKGAALVSVPLSLSKEVRHRGWSWWACPRSLSVSHSLCNRGWGLSKVENRPLCGRHRTEPNTRSVFRCCSSLAVRVALDLVWVDCGNNEASGGSKTDGQTKSNSLPGL